MDPEPPRSYRAAGVGAALILLAGALHLALGTTAISGADTLRDNVDEIEAKVDAGLYFSLETWGMIMLVVGVAELWSVVSFWRRTPNWRLAGLVAAYAGLAASFFALAIFRGPGLVPIVLLLAAIYLFSYHSGERLS